MFKDPLKASEAHTKAAVAQREASRSVGWKTDAGRAHAEAAQFHDIAAMHLKDAAEKGDKGKADGAVPELKSAADKLEALEAKMNENHDEQGRFASGGEASSAAYMASSKADMARDKAIIIGTRGENEKAAILQRIAAQAHRTASSRLTKEYTINPSATKLAQAQSHEFAAMNHDSKAAYHDARAKGVPLPISHARTNSF